MEAPAAQPSHDFLQRQFVIHHRREGEVLRFHVLLERLGLHQRTRKTIQQKAATAADTAAPFADHLPHRQVRNQRAAPHVLDGRSHCRRLIAIASAPGGAEDVASGKMASAQALMQQIGLRALAHTRRAQQHQPPRRSPGFTEHTAGGPCNHSARSLLFCTFMIPIGSS